MVQNQELTEYTTVDESAYPTWSSLLLAALQSLDEALMSEYVSAGKAPNKKISDFFLLQNTMALLSLR